MLSRPDAPARRLPYTTADMSERLAKRKAEQDAEEFKANVLRALANYKPKEDKPWYKDVAGAIGGAAKTGLGAAAGIVNTAVATPLDIADFGVQQLERLVGVKPTDKFDPASMGSFNLLGETYRGIDKAANYVAGNIAATPGVGKPSSSPFMDTVRSRGWAEALAEPLVHGINVASVAYPASKMAVGAKFPETIANAYRQRLLERDIAAQNNLFPAVQRPANVIDVDGLQSSRLPSRVVDSPAPPATRLAQAQTTRALPPLLQRALPPAPLAPATKFTIGPYVPLDQTTWKPGSPWTHYTTPEEAANLLQNGILATSAKEGSNLGRVKGLPPGTFFAGQEGLPFMEYMAAQYQDFINPNNMTKVAVNIPKDAKILELTDEKWAIRELREQGFTPEQRKVWEQYLAKATADNKFGDSFQVAATNFAKDMGFDAVRMDQQIAILPRQGSVPTSYLTETSPPATPATRLAQAQTTRALPPASIPKPGMVIPDSLAGIRDLPTLPSRLNFADFQAMPEYQQYLQAGQQLPTAKELADFGFDPERAYMVHSGAGDLTGDVLDPNFTGRANPAVAALNNTQIKNVIAKTTRANAYVDELSKGLEEFNRTGIWNGQQIGNNITNQIKNFGRLDFVDELALNENLTAAQLGETNTQRFVERINRVINSQKSYLDTFQQPANLARQGNFLSMYPASVGTHNGYLFGEQPTTYLVGPNTNQITQGLGPGVFEPTAQVNVPEYQVFGQQSPLASINYQPQFRPSLDQMAAARAFFLRKVIEDRMARGLYEQ